MSDFDSVIRRRVSEVRERVTEAVQHGDDYLVDLLENELETLTKLAADHHVHLDQA